MQFLDWNARNCDVEWTMNTNQLRPSILVVLSALMSLFIADNAYASCKDYLSWSGQERKSFLNGWMAGTGMITSNQKLNIFGERIQQAVKERYPCVGGDCEIVARTHFAIQDMHSNYRNGLLASLHRDDFYAAVDEYCESSDDPRAYLGEAIPVALGNMARTGKYTLMSYGIVLNGEERIAEMYSSQYVGEGLSGGRSISQRSLTSLCESKSGPVSLKGQDTLSISVGAAISLNQVHIDAIDHNGEFVSGVPLRIRQVNWLKDFRTIKLDYESRYPRIRALQAGEIEFEAVSLCPQDPKASKTFRLVISEP